MIQFMGCDLLVCDRSRLRTLQDAICFVQHNPSIRTLTIHSTAYGEMLRAEHAQATKAHNPSKTPAAVKRCSSNHSAGANVVSMQR